LAEKLSEEPLPGSTKDLVLILKLQSDVIFIGLPNAGKSSMLNLLSDANAKIAAYAFTTLEPQLGLMDGIKLMDLPGLIEGTFEGKGLGTRFVKHTETSRLVAHFISLENMKSTEGINSKDEPDLMENYKVMRKEIENIDPKLFAKPELVVLTKTDSVEPSLVKKGEKIFQEIGVPVVSVSIIDDAAIAKLRAKIKEMLSNI
jgi:GTP-binding protein